MDRYKVCRLVIVTMNTTIRLCNSTMYHCTFTMQVHKKVTSLHEFLLKSFMAPLGKTNKEIFKRLNFYI